jgi:hypothetical protein
MLKRAAELGAVVPNGILSSFRNKLYSLNQNESNEPELSSESQIASHHPRAFSQFCVAGQRAAEQPYA